MTKERLQATLNTDGHLSINDFFCGFGGMSIGFEDVGFSISGAWDNNPYAIKEYSENVGSASIADVSKMSWHAITKAICWTFGFPCQDISYALQVRKGKGLQGQRSGMFFEIMRLLDETNEHCPDNMPPFLVAENVDAVEKYIPTIEAEFNKRGYTLKWKKYNSRNWGVPQNRSRYYFVGIRDIDLFNKHEMPIEQNESVELVTILDRAVDKKYYVKPEKAKTTIESGIMRLLAKSGTRKERVFAAMKNHDPLIVDTRQRKDGVRLYEDVVPTITATCYKEPKMVLVPYDNACPSDLTPYVFSINLDQKDYQFYLRKLTPNEYGKSQGFPMLNWNQLVSDSRAYEGFGNACSPPIVRAIAKSIREVC